MYVWWTAKEVVHASYIAVMAKTLCIIEKSPKAWSILRTNITKIYCKISLANRTRSQHFYPAKDKNGKNGFIYSLSG